MTTIANSDQHILDQQKQDKGTLDTQQKSVTIKLSSLQVDMKSSQSLQANLASQKKEEQALLTQLQS